MTTGPGGACRSTRRTTSAVTSGRSTRWTSAATACCWETASRPARSELPMPCCPVRGLDDNGWIRVRGRAGDQIAGPVGLAAQDDDHLGAAAVAQHADRAQQPRRTVRLRPKCLRTTGPAPAARGQQHADDTISHRFPMQHGKLTLTTGSFLWNRPVSHATWGTCGGWAVVLVSIRARREAARRCRAPGSGCRRSASRRGRTPAAERRRQSSAVRRGRASRCRSRRCRPAARSSSSCTPGRCTRSRLGRRRPPSRVRRSAGTARAGRSCRALLNSVRAEVDHAGERGDAVVERHGQPERSDRVCQSVGADQRQQQVERRSPWCPSPSVAKPGVL